MLNYNNEHLLSQLSVLHECRICPRNCGVDRFVQLGYCRLNEKINISCITLHKGEEPVLVGSKGICNVFFPHCNLQCLYCQNHQISNNANALEKDYRAWELTEIVETIGSYIQNGVPIVGFVSPSHCIPQMKIIIQALRQAGLKFTTVYNTNGYDTIASLQSLEEYVDVYLPDFKYIDSEIAKQYSQAPNYPQIALLAIQEMYRQKGSTVFIHSSGYIESGLIVRHLVLPNMADQSIRILEHLADISTNLYISLMSQYYPTHQAIYDPKIGRTLYVEEYNTVVRAMNELGFYRGWVQELQSQTSYRPDFKQDKPFAL